MEFFLFLAYVILLIVNAMIANEKNRSVGWVIVASLFLSPIFSYLYLLAVPAKEAKPQSQSQEQEKQKKDDDWADD